MAVENQGLVRNPLVNNVILVVRIASWVGEEHPSFAPLVFCCSGDGYLACCPNFGDLASCMSSITALVRD